MERTLATEYGPVRYRVVGREAAGGAALVFIHGLLADGTMWQPQVETFSTEYTCLNWDMPCHGESRPYQGFTYEKTADHLAKIMDAEGIARAVMVGLSLGGYVAQVMAHRHPDKVEAILAADSGPMDISYLSKSDVFWLKRTAGLMRLYPYGRLIADMAKQHACTTPAQEAAKRIFGQYSKEEVVQLTGIAYGTMVEYLEQHPEPERLACPVGLLLGDRDRTGKVPQYSRAWSQREGYPLTMIEHAAHLSNLDNPRQFNAALEAFVQAL